MNGVVVGKWYIEVMEEKRFEDLVYRALTKFYQNVILPNMVSKEDLGVVKKEVEMVGSKVESLDAKVGDLDASVENLEAKMASTEKAIWKIADHQGKKLDVHEKRISNLEESALVV